MGKATWIPLTQGRFRSSLVEIGPLVLQTKMIKFCQFIYAMISP